MSHRERIEKAIAYHLGPEIGSTEALQKATDEICLIFDDYTEAISNRVRNIHKKLDDFDNKRQTG